MSRPRAPQPAKLIIGLFLHDKALLEDLSDILQARFGAVEMMSEWFDFDFTQYYTAEMGTPLYRRMLVFKELIEQQALAGIKCQTNILEAQFALNGKRRVNIDPGYLLYERFVLATGKNFTHRIYIGEGIYADLTLMYQKGAYRPLPWTYPDYATADMRAFLDRVRQHYAADLARLPNTGNREEHYRNA
jgi:hypothetical protein